MPWSAGSYTKGNAGTGGWAGDASAGIGIEAGRHDTQDNDFATGINQCLNKDGSNAATGNIDLGTHYLVNANRIGIGTTTPSVAVHVATGNQRFFQSGASSISAFASAGTNVNLDLCAGQTSYNSNGAAIRLQSSGASDDGQILFSTNLGGTGSAERFRIANTGYLGIGNTSPAVLVDSARSANDSLTRIRLQNANAGASAQTHLDLGNDQNASAAGMILNSSANTGGAGVNSLNIYNGLSAPIRVQAGGSGGVDLASGATSWAAVSDERLKKNIQSLEYGLAEITQLAPVRFDYKNDSSDESKRIGFIAQDVLDVIPEAVSGAESTFYGLSATELIPALVNAVKQLNAKVEALEAQLSATTVIA